MARRIPPDTDVQIIRAYLLGIGRDETAKAYSVSGGHVSAIWDEFRRLCCYLKNDLGLSATYFKNNLMS